MFFSLQLIRKERGREISASFSVFFQEKAEERVQEKKVQEAQSERERESE